MNLEYYGFKHDEPYIELDYYTTYRLGSIMQRTENQSLEYSIDEDLQYLTTFFNLEKTRIKSVINAFNTNGANVTYNKIIQLAGLEIDIEGINLRDALASIVHFYKDHRKLFQSSLSTSKAEKKIISDLHNFLKSLNKKGLEGLNLIYASIENEERPTLFRIDDKLLLTEILDHNNKQVGYLPLMHLTLSFLDEDEEDRKQSFFLSLDSFNTLVNSLQKAQSKAAKSVKHYQNKLVKSVILTGDN